jgi:hypothetical protein
MQTHNTFVFKKNIAADGLETYNCYLAHQHPELGGDYVYFAERADRASAFMISGDSNAFGLFLKSMADDPPTVLVALHKTHHKQDIVRMAQREPIYKEVLHRHKRELLDEIKGIVRALLEERGPAHDGAKIDTQKTDGEKKRRRGRRRHRSRRSSAQETPPESDQPSACGNTRCPVVSCEEEPAEQKDHQCGSAEDKNRVSMSWYEESCTE